jgi:membrane protein DedA with SNARE-associated domain
MNSLMMLSVGIVFGMIIGYSIGYLANNNK